MCSIYSHYNLASVKFYIPYGSDIAWPTATVPGSCSGRQRHPRVGGCSRSGVQPRHPLFQIPTVRLMNTQVRGAMPVKVSSHPHHVQSSLQPSQFHTAITTGSQPLLQGHTLAPGRDGLMSSFSSGFRVYRAELPSFLSNFSDHARCVSSDPHPEPKLGDSRDCSRAQSSLTVS